MLHVGKTADGRAFTLPLDIVTQTVAILARRGAGKSYTASVVAEELLAAKQQVVVLDPTGGWYGLRSSADGASDGFPVLVIGGDHGDIPLEEAAGEMLAAAIVENRFSAVVDVSLFRKGQMRRFVTPFLESLYRLNREPVHLFIDEADDVCPQRPFGDEAQMVGAVEDVVKRGRKKGIGCTLITQRPADLAKQVLTQVEMLVAMRLSHPLDMKAVMEWINVHADPDEAQGMMESLPGLPTGTAWFWSPLMDLFSRVQVRQRKTFDSGATPKPGQAVREPKRITKVDVAALGEKIKGMAEKAKANDPNVLKRRVAELERQLKTLPAAAPAKVERVEVPVWTTKDRAMLQDCKNAIQEATPLLIALERAITLADCKVAMRGVAIFPRAKSHPPAAPPAARVADLRPSRTPAQPHFSGPAGDCGKLGRAQRMILSVLAQHGAKRKVQVAVMAGYSVGGGAFCNAIGSLVSGGLVVRNGEMLEATAEGVAALGSAPAPLPTGHDLIAYWMAQLGKAEREVLQVLTCRYPQQLTKQDIAEATESHYAPDGGAFGNALGRLRTLELIVGRGMISASPHLMEG